MGYCIYIEESKFSIKAENKAAALKAVQGLHGKERIKDSSGKHFSWVSSDFYELDTLEDMLEEWRWKPKIDLDTGDVLGVEFTGEKYGDDDFFFQSLSTLRRSWKFHSLPW